MGDDLVVKENKLWIYISLGMGLLIILFIKNLIKKNEKRKLLLLILYSVLEILEQLFSQMRRVICSGILLMAKGKTGITSMVGNNFGELI